MKLVSAGLTFVNVTTIAGLVLGLLAGGLDSGFAGLAMLLGAAAAVCAWIWTKSFRLRSSTVITPPAPAESEPPKSRRAQRRSKGVPETTTVVARADYHIWAWGVGLVFLVFAVRSFCWLLYTQDGNFKIQSPNNLGDLALHITFIKYFANGVPLWPENPIFPFGGLRYPVGIDLFNSILLLQHIDLIRGLVWVGLLASAATFYGFYRWGGSFAVAGFLFNGGLSGFAFFNKREFRDYLGEHIAWKSIALTMFVTQRGLLYAIPVGLILLIHWRRKYFPAELKDTQPVLLPWWVEWSLYASLPLFHIHTFLSLSIVLGFWLLIGSWEVRKQVGLTLAAAFLPATWLVWLTTDHFHAKSIMDWKVGWLQSEPDYTGLLPGDTGIIPHLKGICDFWVNNFGLTLGCSIALISIVAWEMWRGRNGWKVKVSPTLAFVAPAIAIFLFAYFVKTAPWPWDNMKLIVWAYFIFLPFIWTEVVRRTPVAARAGICFLLFFSGFVTLFGVLKQGGYDLAKRAEVNGVTTATKPLPITARFAAYPTYNHPLLLSGRKVVLGYPGHLWSQGFDYGPTEQQLQALMRGAPDWREKAAAIGARYLFWGTEEKRAYATSSQPWRTQAREVTSGDWGTIYDLEASPMTLGQ